MSDFTLNRKRKGTFIRPPMGKIKAAIIAAQYRDVSIFVQDLPDKSVMERKIKMKAILGI
jgi:hypothetical protein